MKVVEEIAAGTVPGGSPGSSAGDLRPHAVPGPGPHRLEPERNAIHNKVRGLVPGLPLPPMSSPRSPVKVFAVAETGERTGKAPGTVLARPAGGH